MSDLDERENGGRDPEIEKDWDKIRKKLRRKLNNVNPTTAKVQRRAAQVIEDEKRSNDCSIKVNPEVDERGEKVYDRDAACGLDAISKNAGPKENKEIPTPSLPFDPAPPIDGRASLFEQALAAERQKQTNTTPSHSPSPSESAAEQEALQENKKINPTEYTMIPLTPQSSLDYENTQTKTTNFQNRPPSLDEDSQTKPYKNINRPPSFPRTRIGEDPEFIDESFASGPERSGVILLRAIQSGNLAASELDQDERRVIVKILKDQGRTQDEISAMLQVSRRTIVSDYKWIRLMAAEEVRNLDTYDVAGEIWDQAQNAIQKALHDNKFRTVSQILRDMVEMLQSLGVLYRAPTTSKVASIVGHVQAHQGYTKYMETVGNEKDQVIDVLKAMMTSIQEGGNA